MTVVEKNAAKDLVAFVCEFDAQKVFGLLGTRNDFPRFVPAGKNAEGVVNNPLLFSSRLLTFCIGVVDVNR